MSNNYIKIMNRGNQLENLDSRVEALHASVNI